MANLASDLPSDVAVSSGIRRWRAPVPAAEGNGGLANGPFTVKL